MSKIYNEIVIDMNPESSTFKETLFEDSFEYSGDIMLMQGTGIPEYGSDEMESFREEHGDKVRFGDQYFAYNHMHRRYIPAPVPSDTSGWTQIQTSEEYAAGVEGSEEGSTQEWGAADIGKDDFINPDTNEPRTNAEIYALIDPKLPGITGEQLMNQIADMLPKYQGVAEEERGFAEREKGFAEEEYGKGKEFAREGFGRDVYGVSKQAGKAGAQMRGAYGTGMGAGMRGAYGGMKDIAKQFKFAEQDYKKDLFGVEQAYQKAQLSYEKDIYGLEKGAEQEYEADIAGWLDPEWSAGAKEGGLVPDKESFSHFLTQLPDAGGS